MLFADAVFNIFAGVFMFSMMFAKTSLLFCCFCIRFFQISMLLFVSVYAVMRKLDAIIRVRMLLCESSMPLFTSVCCYANARCYYSCSYAVMRNLDAIIRVRMLLCKTSMLLFVFRIMFVLIRVFRELDRYGLARVIN